ncbi:MAG: lysine--tRNA ligase [Eubacteriales bacterium]|nr:lysine--tRNA ligase [Eubacteriales bacterium]
MDLTQLNEKLSKLSAEVDIRKAKIEFLKDNGIIPYVDRFEKTNSIKEARTLAEGTKVKLAGRIIFRRIMGKFGFMKIQDIEGAIQVSVGRNELDEESYDFYKKLVDVGDFVGVTGEIYTTQTGEITVRALKVELLSKAMRPLPEKFHGLTDQEQKYRQRYLDLISNDESKKVMIGRSKTMTFIRKFLTENGFMEVETPILQSAVCGASAKPFFTKHNALNKMCNLRIAPETYLKQVIASGFDKVFELGKVFRNEGMDTQHLQEFTMCEWYASYWNFEDNVNFFQKFIRSLLTEILGTTTLEYEGHTLDFGKEWERIDYTAKMREILGFDFLEYEDRNELVIAIEKTGLFKAEDFDGIKTCGGVIDYIYKRKIRINLIQPTVLYNYPACLVPLARRNDKDNRIIDMFQVLAIGSELCKAYSELVDPIVQRETFEEQMKAKKAGDDEAMDLDEDFLLAMEHGMPPISGLGFGLDRLMVVMFNQPSVRDVVLFPLMK